MRKRILIAEDNEFNQKLMKLALKQHDIDFACNGIQAVELFKNNCYDLILMDLQMPIMDGIEATFEIRNQENNSPVSKKPIPIIAMTANHDVESECKKAGMTNYLTKPINPQDLIDYINRY